ncbi:MAG: tripartite tricarboxylate transporter substrate binding protein [Candidatus Latescibacterota bacterium]
MWIPRLIVCYFLICMFLLGPGIASGQSYPTKAIRIVTAAVGSANDLCARIVAKDLTGRLGQPAIVENPGGRAVEVVVNAAPDGHTVLFYGSATYTMPLIRSEKYSIADLAPVSLSISSPNIVVVHPSVPVKSLKELIALAKARPGKLNYAAGTVGASPHTSMELFKSMTGVDIVRVPYKGTGPSVLALVAGEVDMMIAGLGSVETFIKSGKLRALAGTSAKRSELIPELPTVAEEGVPGYEAASRMGFYVPAKTPAFVINRLYQEVSRSVKTPQAKELFLRNGIEAVGSTPEEFAALIKTEMGWISKLIREGRIRTE